MPDKHRKNQFQYLIDSALSERNIAQEKLGELIVTELELNAHREALGEQRQRAQDSIPNHCSALSWKIRHTQLEGLALQEARLGAQLVLLRESIRTQKLVIVQIEQQMAGFQAVIDKWDTQENHALAIKEQKNMDEFAARAWRRQLSEQAS